MAAVQAQLEQLAQAPVSLLVGLAAVVLSLIYVFATSRERPYAGFPVVTSDNKELKGASSWFLDGKGVLAKGLRESPGGFQVQTGSGYKIVLPNRFADELRNDRRLNFPEAFTKDLFIHYPGFDAFRAGLTSDTFIQEVVRVKLTQSLGLITDDLVEETTESLHDILGEKREWTTLDMKEALLDIVARLSARVFLGKPLCRNQDWLRISKDHTVDIFAASRELRNVNPLLRPLIYWTIPRCTRLRQQLRDARRLIEPEVEKRRSAAEKLIQAGQKPPKTADAIGWMVEVANGGKIDYVTSQLSLSNAAIHTTSETMSKCVIQLCDTPEIVQPMRDEMIRVLREDGWQKTTLYKMKLLDSFLKEVQRLHGLSTTTMNRMVKKSITLSDGTVLPAGARIMISSDRVVDGSVYPEPTKFQVERFMRLREQPGEENRHQFVTTTSDHMGFGHGQHACPGRFFASNEIKIALCFLLLKYDLRFVPGEQRPAEMVFENNTTTLPNMKIQLRRRQEEINLEHPREA